MVPAARDEVAVAPKNGTLASERVIVNAPMSFAGAAQRAWRLQERGQGASRWAILIGVIVLVLPAWWAFVIAWYLTFGLLLVPYRLLRRGARKRKAEALRHRELLTAVDQNKR
jgi:hypothetical protein